MIATVVTALVPAQVADSTIEEDLAVLKGKWASPEITYKRGKTTITQRFTAEFRGKGEGVWGDKQSFTPPVVVGGMAVMSGGIESGFKYAIEEKDGKRYLRLHGTAFGRPSEKQGEIKEFPVVTTYRLKLKADVLELDEGEIRAWVVVGTLDPVEVVSLKGTWQRVTEKR